MTINSRSMMHFTASIEQRIIRNLVDDDSKLNSRQRKRPQVKNCKFENHGNVHEIHQKKKEKERQIGRFPRKGECPRGG